jgi:DNA-binding transcriptional regulator YiaG
MTEGQLFRRCRQALKLSQSGMAQRLLLTSDRTIRRWEADEILISGPAWIALKAFLQQAGVDQLAKAVVEIIQNKGGC